MDNHRLDCAEGWLWRELARERGTTKGGRLLADKKQGRGGRDLTKPRLATLGLAGVPPRDWPAR